MAGSVVDKALTYFNTLEEAEGNYFFHDGIPESPVIEINITAQTADMNTQMEKSHAKPKHHKEAKVQPQTQEHAIESVAAPQPKPAIQSIDPNWRESANMESLFECIHNCMECPLGATRNMFVFGKGNFNADIMIIGEAPGADEDAQGEPFVGRAGQLLTKILEAINLTREEVFIANIIKCRPPNNRRPTADEVAKCEPYLMKQIDLIKPKFILSLGLTSVDTLLKKSHKMGETRGTLLNYHGITMMVTYHPAALLRNPNWKKDAWEDVKKFRKLYDEYLETKSK